MYITNNILGKNMIYNKLKEYGEDMNGCKRIKMMDSMDNSYYETLWEISKLFNEKKYRGIIGSKSSYDSINQTIIFVNPVNITDKYTLYIHNKYSITITIPIKKTNYIYRTSFTELCDVYNYLKIHV
jgi:hypothetical protein